MSSRRMYSSSAAMRLPASPPSGPILPFARSALERELWPEPADDDRRSEGIAERCVYRGQNDTRLLSLCARILRPEESVLYLARLDVAKIGPES